MPLLINILILIITVGFMLYIINSLPIDATMKNVAHAVILFVVLVWLLQMLLGVSGIGTFKLCP